MNAINDVWEDGSGVPAAATDEKHMEHAEGKLWHDVHDYCTSSWNIH